MRIASWALVLGLILTGVPIATAEATDPGAVDIAAEAGIQDVVRTFSARAGDFTGDGLDDLIVVNHWPQDNTDPYPSVFKNAGSGFSRIPELMTHEDRHVCAFADFNLNGRTDIACANGDFDPEELWVQQSDGSFNERAVQRGLVDNQSSHRTITFINANGDPYPDVYLTRFEKPDRPTGTNTLFLNQGPENSYTFTPAPEWGVNVRDGAFKDADACTIAKDFNADGLQDLAYCSPYGFRLYQNTGSAFVNVAATSGIRARFVDAAWADFNEDGRLDLAHVRTEYVGVRLQAQDGSSHFGEAFAKRLTVGTNLATGDFNGDGHMDIYATQGCRQGYPGTDYPDYLLLGNGTGAGFLVIEEPALPPNSGCGHVAERIDYDGNGDDEFVVLNGHKRRAGPVQLFDWR